MNRLLAALFFWPLALFGQTGGDGGYFRSPLSTNNNVLAGVSNASVKPLWKVRQGASGRAWTNEWFMLQGGANMALSMTATSIIANLADSPTFDGQMTVASGTAANWNSTVFVPAAGHLTNVLQTIQNNTRIVITGTQVVQVARPETLVNPHLTLQGKTNITIEGLGWNSVIKSYQTGTVFCVYNCRDITFRNFANIGTRGPESGGLRAGGFAAFETRGTNINLRFENLFVKDHSDQGISPVFSFDTFNTNVTVKNCWFERIGTTNWSDASTGDGTALIMDGPDWLIEGNTFIQNLNDFEAYSQLSSMPLSGTKFINNYSYRPWNSCYKSQQPNHNDALIQGNTIIYDTGQRELNGLHWAISFSGGRRVKIIGNTIKNADIGIVVSAAAGELIADFLIEGNTIEKNFQGIALNTAATSATNRGAIIRGNHLINNMTEGINFQGQHIQIINNVFNRNGNYFNDFYSSLKGFHAAGFSGPVGSNVISGNIFYTDGINPSNSAPKYCVELSSGFANTIISDNKFGDFVTAAYLDSGTKNVWLRNWIGPHFEEAAPAAVTLTADNLTLDCTNRVYIKLSSDNVTAANRTFVLSQGGQGQLLTIEWVGTNAGEIADDSANTGGGNARLSATWTPTQYDVLRVTFNGTDWVEQARSVN